MFEASSSISTQTGNPRSEGFAIGLKVALAIFVITLFASNSSAACGGTVLHRFSDSTQDKVKNGFYPFSTLIFDAAGNLYGTTWEGGSSRDAGVVFELRAPETKGGCWAEKLLFKFHGPDGANPMAGVTIDGAGNLYGTTYDGGYPEEGVVFELLPISGGRWKEKILYEFLADGKDAIAPTAGVVFDGAGNLYGTASYGGVYNHGAVFELKHRKGGGWTENVLHSFNKNGIDGIKPTGNLVFDASGNLYGTTTGGGPYDYGTVFELTPGRHGAWTEQVLYDFGHDLGYGSDPAAGLIFDAAGNLYGTSMGGTVFELMPQGDGTWMEKTLHQFGNDGNAPSGNLIFDSAGNLYGTTTYGGPNGYGTVFKLNPEGTLTTLYAFDSTDGSIPQAGLVADGAGYLYGTTRSGGTGCYLGCGTVFKVAPSLRH